MIEEYALVVSVDQASATLEIVRKQPCGLCGQTRGCGVSMWGRLFGHKSSLFKADNSINAAEGDLVVVGIEEQAVMSSSMLIYGVPLVGLMLGGLLGGLIAAVPAQNDLYAVIGALGGLGLAYLWLRLHAQGRAMNAQYQPVILRTADTRVINVNCQRGE